MDGNRFEANNLLANTGNNCNVLDWCNSKNESDLYSYGMLDMKIYIQ